MWFTFIGSWFSFLVQCYCLTVYHDLQLPGRLEIILRIRTGPTGRFSYRCAGPRGPQKAYDMRMKVLHFFTFLVTPRKAPNGAT